MKGTIKGMVAGALLGASAAIVYGMMNWRTERKWGEAAACAGKTVARKANQLFGH